MHNIWPNNVVADRDPGQTYRVYRRQGAARLSSWRPAGAAFDPTSDGKTPSGERGNGRGRRVGEPQGVNNTYKKTGRIKYNKMYKQREGRP